MTDLTVANTILQQLGGNRFITMTGAKHLIGSERALSFQLPKRSGVKVNAMRITLTPADDYTVEALVIPAQRGGFKPPFVTETCSGIYCDQLQDVFTRLTGLATRL